MTTLAYTAVDTETTLITPTRPIPDHVVTAVATPDTSLHMDDTLPPGPLCGHNLAYDMCVLSRAYPHLQDRILDVYADGHIHDTYIHGCLDLIAKGTYQTRGKGTLSLARMAGRVGVQVDKEDTWRLHYAVLQGTPVEEWPADARAYAEMDALATWVLTQEQIQRPKPDMVLQARAHLTLQRIGEVGMRVDRDQATRWCAQVASAHAAALTAAPFRRKNGTANQKALQAHVESHWPGPGPVPLTPTGRVSTSADTLAQVGTPECQAILHVAETAKLMSTYIPIVRGADRVHPSYQILVDTGRTSCRAPNLQNPPRAEGFRQCFVPDDGQVWVVIDYDAVELRSLAQICYTRYKYSDLRDALCRGQDLHVRVAATLLSISYDDAHRRYVAGDPEAKNARQFAKIANYGLAGGMGAQAFSDYARGYGIRVSVDRCREIKDAWMATWREMSDYFRDAAEVTAYGPGTLTQVRSGRVRGGLTFTQAANTLFQGLVADGAKDTLFALHHACYHTRGALGGAQVQAFLHDEYIVGVPVTRVDDYTPIIKDIVIDTMQRWHPDVPITATPRHMHRWEK